MGQSTVADSRNFVPGVFHMVLHCSKCQSTRFRLSRVRGSDLFRLCVLFYPIRCLECLGRSYVFLPVALMLRSHRRKHA
jgi:hypothetical protein